MVDCERYILGADGIVFIKESLKGVNVMCDALLRVVECNEGEAFTIAPRGVTHSRIVEFNSGGLVPGNLDPSRAVRLEDGSIMMPVATLMEEHIRELLRIRNSKRDAVCIVDDFNPKWSEYPGEPPAMAFGVEEEVYYLLDETAAEEELERAICLGNALWHGAAAVCAVRPMIDANRNCADAEMRRSIETVLLFTLRAYDGEGFVAWRRG